MSLNGRLKYTFLVFRLTLSKETLLNIWNLFKLNIIAFGKPHQLLSF